jgi:hypothetical protein
MTNNNSNEYDGTKAFDNQTKAFETLGFMF